MPFLRVLQSSGLNIALLTDGRLSGASGQVLSAIHVSPDTLHNGAIGKVSDGDWILIDAQLGIIQVEISQAELDQRPAAKAASEDNENGAEVYV